MPALSPDGKKIALLGRSQGQRVLLVHDLDKRTRNTLMAAQVDSFEVQWCRFKNDDRILCGMTGTASKDGRPYPVSRLVAVDVSGKEKPRVLVQNGALGVSQYHDRILSWLRDDPKHVLVELGAEGSVFPTVYALDIYSGRFRVVQRSRTPILSWHADRAGVVRFGSGYDNRRSQYLTRDSAESDWRTLAKWERGAADFAVVGFSPTPGTLLVKASHHGRDAIFEMDLTEQNDRQLLFAHPEVDVGVPIYWPTDRRIVGFTVETDRVRRHLFDAEAKSIYSAIDQLLPDAENSVVDASRDGKRLLVASNADVRPMDFLLLDLETQQMQRLSSANPDLAKAVLSPMKPIEIKGPGGITLHGYLTLPVDSDGKNVPMVVYPHGGPHARDSWGFDPMVQFMASRGYAVLQVNFRGSMGYGEDWYAAGLRNWGTVMVDDITAAARWAFGEGIADPKRTCIVGWSYGGYAALMSAIREGDLYRCAVSIAGVSDLRALVGETRRFYGGRFNAQHWIGSDTDELKAGSPLRSAERINVPVLLVHGDNDSQVMVDHSRRMARALTSADKQNELVIIEDGNHSLTRFEWMQTLLTELEEFLDSNIGRGEKE